MLDGPLAFPFAQYLVESSSREPFLHLFIDFSGATEFCMTSGQDDGALHVYVNIRVFYFSLSAFPFQPPLTEAWAGISTSLAHITAPFWYHFVKFTPMTGMLLEFPPGQPLQWMFEFDSIV
jgi:hypothetical protein